MTSLELLNLFGAEIGVITPKIIHVSRIFPYKPSILGIPYLWKPPFCQGGRDSHWWPWFLAFVSVPVTEGRPKCVFFPGAVDWSVNFKKIPTRWRRIHLQTQHHASWNHSNLPCGLTIPHLNLQIIFPAVHLHWWGIVGPQMMFPTFSNYKVSVYRWIAMSDYSLVNIQITMEHHHFLWVNQLFLWPFPIASS